ncbi:PREDICTED: uncharacterized protein LOC109158417 [Ipomoea nil]|uniref:uncharacterized protein LOC109158417 n=1 Tax=Ipomoea nil TaxID=35883 RepID=UPI0009010A67|nr:PREDICTED: uncharacterized protein LOC109158417 [Ipomoea nil]
MWKCARSCTVPTFTAAMRELRDLDVKAWEWLNDKHPREWSRSHFSCTPQSDMLVNNISECFNSIILAVRGKPIIACLDGMRHLLMTRFFDSYHKAKEWSSEICPRVLEKLQVNEKQAARYGGFQCGLHEFEIQGFYGDQQSVNLELRSCTCRRWDLTGLPCKHAICAIWMKHGEGHVYAYVNPCYTKARYLQIYEGLIHPMAGVSEWPVVDTAPPLPPVYKAKPGRPKKLRKSSTDEITNDGEHVARTWIKLHCSKCRQSGHNSRRCPLNTQSKEKQMKPRKKVGDPVHVQVELPPTEDGVNPTIEAQEENNILIEAGYDPTTVFSLEDLEWSQNN